VDRSIFHPFAKQSGYDLPQKYVLFVGTLEPRKNLQGLLRAWSEIKDEFNKTYLVIAGSPGTVFEPLRLTAALERVLFLGYVDDANLPGLYAGATAFVLPSIEEGFGLPALEAMACGTPVIVSDGGAMPETVGSSAMIFRLSDPGSLTTALRRCLEDEQMRSDMKEKGLARAEQFKWQTTAEQVWNTLYEI
jgi:glycosyltransferase involved in cell wall biosynthesis